MTIVQKKRACLATLLVATVTGESDFYVLGVRDALYPVSYDPASRELRDPETN